MKIKIDSFSSPGNSPESKSINWKNSSDRKWLMNHLHWAMNNGVKVSLIPDSF